MEKTAERSQALEANLETDVRYRHVSASKELTCLFDSFADEILVRSLEQPCAEGPDEMIPGEVRLPAERGNVELSTVAGINQSQDPLQR
jgi:hypothetical protein